MKIVIPLQRKWPRILLFALGLALLLIVGIGDVGFVYQKF